MTEQQQLEMMSYIRRNIQDYDEKLSVALDRLAFYRCPLYWADGVFYTEMEQMAEDWIDEYNSANEEQVDKDELCEPDLLENLLYLRDTYSVMVHNGEDYEFYCWVTAFTEEDLIPMLAKIMYELKATTLLVKKDNSKEEPKRYTYPLNF